MSAARLDAQDRARLEQAAMAALPARTSHEEDGWLLRLSGGGPKRANAVYPRAASTVALDERLRRAEERFAAQGQPLTLRLTEHEAEGDLDAALAARGYARLDPSWVLWRALEAPAATADGGFVQLDRESWLAHWSAFDEGEAARHALHAGLLRGLSAGAVWGAVVRDGRVLAVGLAVVDQEWVGVFDLITHPSARRQGCARALIDGLLGVARTQGAHRAYLQCIADNAPAAALYRTLGFRRAYRYWYRRHALA